MSCLLKGCLLALVVGGLGIAGLFFLAFRGTQPMVNAAEGFLGLVGQGRTREAYQATSAAFRKASSEDDLARVVRTLGLDGYASSSWSSRSFENQSGHLEGTVTLKNGGTVSLKMDLVYEEGAWKVKNLDGTRSGGSSDSRGPSGNV